MRKYETIFIAKPDLGEDETKGISEKVQEIIANMKGECQRLEDWGIRKLAYPINKCVRGRYFYVNFSGSAPLIAELERRLRLDDKILRYQSVKLDKEVAVLPVAEAPVAEAPVEIIEESTVSE
jgi:small subunit ribosomal protein S6